MTTKDLHPDVNAPDASILASDDEIRRADGLSALPPVKSSSRELAKEFGWALLFTAFGILVILLGSAGPQFIYAGF